MNSRTTAVEMVAALVQEGCDDPTICAFLASFAANWDPPNGRRKLWRLRVPGKKPRYRASPPSRKTIGTPETPNLPATSAPRILYTGIRLDDTSRQKLTDALRGYIPDGWDVVAHHMTIAHGSHPDFRPLGLGEEGVPDTMTVTHVGVSDKAVAARVTPSRHVSKNRIAHITLAVNRANGGKPAHSNDIVDWREVPHFNVFGRSQNFGAS